jgi:hypothetical protein
MDNNLKGVVGASVNNVVPDSVVPSTKCSLISRILSKIYSKKLYILVLLLVIGAVFFYYKKKNLLKNKLKDFKTMHTDFKPVTELNKELELKDNELLQLKQQFEQLTNDNNKLLQNQQLLHDAHNMLLQKQSNNLIQSNQMQSNEQMQTGQMQTGQMQSGQSGQMQSGQSGQMQSGQMQSGQSGQMQSGQMQPVVLEQFNNNDRLENEVEYDNLGEDENVQQFNLTNNEMNDVTQALEQ